MGRFILSWRSASRLQKLATAATAVGLAAGAVAMATSLLLDSNPFGPPSNLRTGSLSADPPGWSGYQNFDGWTDAQLASLMSNMRDLMQRSAEIKRDLGQTFLQVYFDYPGRLALGDEGQLLIHVTCGKCPASELRIGVESADGISLTPSTIPAMSLGGDSERLQRILLTPRSVGTKGLIISAVADPPIAEEQLESSSAYVIVEPATSIFGIPAPYLEFARGLSAAVGLPALSLALLSYALSWWRARQKQKTPVIHISH